MKKKSPLPLIVALILAVGAVIGMTVLNNATVTHADAHDHDKDGRPDHAAGQH